MIMKFKNLRFEARAHRHGTDANPGKFGVLVYAEANWYDPVCEFVTPAEARKMAQQLLEAAASAVLGQTMLEVQYQLKQITAEFGGQQEAK